MPDCLLPILRLSFLIFQRVSLQMVTGSTRRMKEYQLASCWHPIYGPPKEEKLLPRKSGTEAQLTDLKSWTHGDDDEREVVAHSRKWKRRSWWKEYRDDVKGGGLGRRRGRRSKRRGPRKRYANGKWRERRRGRRRSKMKSKFRVRSSIIIVYS